MKSIALLIVAFFFFGIAVLRSKQNQKLIDNGWMILSFIFGVSFFLNIILEIFEVVK